MGISGLLLALKSIQKPRHIKHWVGKTVAVDAYGWLHRGIIACAIDLALNKPTNKHVDFAMGRVKMLLHFGVTPYLVFDGDYLPSKASEEAERATRREESKKAGLELLRQGKTKQAYLEFQRAVDVTPQMARHLIDALIEANVQYVVAPYEADAQMYYLERMGIVDAIVSEDSDLLVFGCKNLITKLSQYGECVDIYRGDFAACKEISLAGWSNTEFRSMAILSGCDYLENIPRLGLRTAHRLVRKHKVIDNIIKALRFEGQFIVPADYLESFRRAELTFLHQRVYCPRENRVVMCTESETSLTDEDLVFIGPEIEESLAQGIARGELDPMTKLPLVVGGRHVPITKPNLGPRSKPESSVGTLLSFFKPVTPCKNVKAPLAQRGTVKDQLQKPTKRPSSMIGHEDKLYKKQRVPEQRITESLGGGEFSKYFKEHKTNGSRLELPPDEKTPEINTPLPETFDKEDVESGLKSVFPHDSSEIIAATEAIEQDVIKVVAQGWRDRYSLKPHGNTTPLASLIAKGSQEPPKMMRTPLQRIGANAMQGAGRTPHQNIRQAAERPTGSDGAVSLQKFAKGSSIDPFPAEVENTSPRTIDEGKTTQTGNASTFSFNKFLYTQS